MAAFALSQKASISFASCVVVCNSAHEDLEADVADIQVHYDLPGSPGRALPSRYSSQAEESLL